MATFTTLGSVATSGEFQERVAYAMAVAASNVYSESSSVVGHVARSSYAWRVANGNYNLSAAVLMVLGNATIAAEATLGSNNSVPDSDIQFSVNSLWNVLAGA